MPPGNAPVANFGRNIRFVPRARLAPRDTDELLKGLRAHAGERFRCIGAGHSWSRVAATDGILLDLCHLDHVEIDPSRRLARVGGGCTIGRLLDRLREDGLTLPTLGAITKQTIAGAIATGTHGSGESSLSHFVEAVTVAAPVAEDGAPGLRVIEGGAELEAARCALGCLGAIVEVVIRVVERYRIEERVQKTASLDAVLAPCAQWPLQQFALLPWSWTYVVYRRRRTGEPKRPLRALLCRLWNLAMTDVLLHVALKAVLGIPAIIRSRAVRGFFALLPRLVLAGPRRIDDSTSILTMRHDLFRHVEMELFVPEPKLKDAVAEITEIVKVAGLGKRPGAELQALSPGRLDEIEKLRGSYTLHYPLFFRRVSRDDTLISMASAAAGFEGAWYSISVFTYRTVDADFASFARTLARCLIERHGARLHWGKFTPLPLETLAETYPRHAEFREICRRYDPAQEFWY